MGTVAHYVEVNAPAQACYDWWRPLTRLPEIMSDVRKVESKEGSADRTEWTVSGPAGTSVTWEAEIVEDSPPHKIAWSSVDSSDPDLKNAGVVRFDDRGDGTTGVEVSLEYDPPGGKLGDAVAAISANPQGKVEQAVAEFKTIIETR
jgi:uncharacterized membrane protein